MKGFLVLINNLNLYFEFKIKTCAGIGPSTFNSFVASKRYFRFLAFFSARFELFDEIVIDVNLEKGGRLFFFLNFNSFS